MAVTLLLSLFFYLGTRIGNGSAEQEAVQSENTPQEAPSATALEKTKADWKRMDLSIDGAIGFREICLKAIRVESVSTAPDSALSQLINQLSFEQAWRLLSEIDYTVERVTRSNAVQLLQDRLAKLDPQKTIQRALLFDSGAIQTDLIEAGFREWALLDIQAALNDIGLINDANLAYLVKRQILGALSKQSPSLAMDFAEEEGLYFPENSSEAMMANWVSRDLEGACEAVLRMESEYAWPARLHLFEAICQELLTKDPDRVVSIWQQLLNHDYRIASSYMATSLIKTWSETDPHAALEFVLNNTKTTRGHRGINGIPVNKWMTEDPQAAADWLLKIEDKSLQSSLINSLGTKAIEKLPPESLFSLVEEIPPTEREQSLWRSVFISLPDESYPELMQWINQQPDNRIRNRVMWYYVEYCRGLNEAKLEAAANTFHSTRSAYFIGALAVKWAKRDAPAAWRWIQTQQHKSIYPELVGKYSEYLATTDPSAALKTLQQVSQPMVRRHTYNVVRELMDEKPEQALDWIQQGLSGETRKQAIRTYLRFFNSTKPEHVFEAIRELSPDEREDIRYSNLLNNIDPDEAIAFVRRLPPEVRPVGDLIEMVAYRDPNLAKGLLSDSLLTAGQDMAELQASLARAWVEKDKYAALQWAVSLPTVEGENKALNRALVELVRYQDDPDFAKEAVARMTSVSAQNAAIRKVSKILIRYNPIETYEWANRYGNDETRQQVIADVTDELLLRDSARASVWVDNLPSGPQRDTAALKIINSLLSTSPEEAFPWALSLSKPQSVQNQLKRVLNDWKRVAPEDAYRAVQYSRSLSEEQKQRLLETFE